LLGWNISVHRITGNPAEPATVESTQGTRLAVWQTGPDGLQWINQLVESGQAIDLGGNGYPNRYTARADRLLPQIIGGPPQARANWGSDDGDILLPQWVGKTFVDRAAMDECKPEEWLLIIAWDES
jgi:hypothetical protein